MMLARIRLQASPTEPVAFALDGALIPLPIARRFSEALAEAMPGGEVWLIRCSSGAAALLYPDAYAVACTTFPRFLPAPADGTTPNNKNPRRCNAEGSEELFVKVQSQTHCSAEAAAPPVRRAS